MKQKSLGVTFSLSQLPLLQSVRDYFFPMKKLAHRIVSLFAIAILLTSGVPAVSSAAIPPAVKLTIHYQRADTDYTNWNLWLWKNVTTGTDVDVNKAGVAFTESDDLEKLHVLS
jgi:hypothetical protein